ncbi:MAG: Holliday junction branch migration protein RuvA [bacterium]|nr:Holliday junction branch migration protein RuvA [bacterium]
MIDSVRGNLVEKLPTSVVIDNGGIGYKIQIPLSTYHKLPDKFKEIALYTHLVVKEDSLNLYGFATCEERELFLSLKSTSGIGPKSALSILSQISSLENFKMAIGKGEVQVLTSFSGIGKKTAQRIIIELQEKFKISEAVDFLKKEDKPLIDDAIMALVSLGFKKNEAIIAIQKVRKHQPQLNDIEEIIKIALGYL